MARQYWVAPIPPFHTADGPPLTAAALADASPTPPVVLPANILEPGTSLEIQAYGRFTTTATPGTVVLGLYIGPPATAIGSVTAVAVTAAITPVASQTNRTFRIEGNARVRTVGTSGSIIGALEISNVTSNGTDLAPATAPTAGTIDTTQALSVRLGVTPSVATGSWTLHHWGVRLVS